MNGVINVSSVRGVAEIDTGAGAGLDIEETDSRTSSVATANPMATAAVLVAGLVGATWFARRRLA